MPYDRPSFYVTFGGTLYPLASQHEQWSTGCKFSSLESQNLADYVAALPAISIADILVDATELIKGTDFTGLMWSSHVTVDWAKLALLDVDGRYADSPKLAEQTGQVGTSGNAVMVPQLAAAVSTWSGSTFGKANRGRSYLPCPATFYTASNFPNTDPRTSVAQAGLLRDAYRAFLHKVSGEVSTVGLTTYPAIMSKLGTGTTKYIQQIGCGRVIDTMRSRRASLSEEPVWVSYM